MIAYRPLETLYQPMRLIEYYEQWVTHACQLKVLSNLSSKYFE